MHSGIALFHAMQEQYPTIPMVLLTGHPLSKEMEYSTDIGAGWLVAQTTRLDQPEQFTGKSLDCLASLILVVATRGRGCLVLFSSEFQRETHLLWP
jgi:hypothetical protein